MSHAQTNKIVSALCSSSRVQLTSCNGHYNLVMQEDGNLVVYRGNTFTPNNAVYATGSNSRGAPFTLALEPTGNLIVKDHTGSKKWESNTYHKASPCTLILTDHGKLELIDGNGCNYWTSPVTHPQNQQPNYPSQQPTYPSQQPNYPHQQPNYPHQQPNYPPPNYFPPQPVSPYPNYPSMTVQATPNYAIESLHSPQELKSNNNNTLYTADFRHRVVIEQDGQLCLYNSGNVLLWRSNSKPGPAPYTFAMQADGNAVVYDANKKAIYHTSTWDAQSSQNGPFQFKIHEGHCAVYNKHNRQLWKSS